MKQKKFGKKIVNWRRPLGPSQLRRRYLRLRHEDPDYQDQNQFEDYPGEDEFWDPYDPSSGYPCSCCTGRQLWTPYTHCLDDLDNSTDEDRQVFFLRQLFEGVLSPWPLFTRGRTIDAAPGRDIEGITSPLGPHRDINGIEKRVAAYIEMATNISDNSVAAALRSQIVASIGDLRHGDVLVADLLGNPNFIKLIESTDDAHFDGDFHTSTDFANLLCLFGPFWISRPHAWDKNSLTELLEYLFVLYSVPKFLYHEWFRDLGSIRFKWLSWFILLGQGGSLKHASKFFNWIIPAKFQQYLLEAPPEASPVEACLYAEVKRLGGSETDFRRIHQNAAFIIDPTEPSAVESHPGFWRDTVRWLITHSDEITDEESDLILSWAMHEYTESERAGTSPFSWRGRSVRNVIERSIQYGRSTNRPWLSFSWNSSGLNWVPDDPLYDGWSFLELTSGRDLFNEGEALHHCVGGYAGRCASGYSAIVSMRYHGISRLTIEIAPKTRHIVQARGLQNRDATRGEKGIISHWMRRVVRQYPTDQA